jgi:TRAP-type uncharacterized transport system fused permease subunit
MGIADRILRALIAVAIVILFLMHTIKGTVGLILLIIAIVFLITSAAGLCPLYNVLGIKTRRDRVKA